MHSAVSRCQSPLTEGLLSSPGVALAGTNPALDLTGCSLPSNLPEDKGKPQKGSRQVQHPPAAKCEAKIGAQVEDSAWPFCDVPSSPAWPPRGGEQRGQTEEEEGRGPAGRAGFGSCVHTPRVQKNEEEESQVPGMGKAVEGGPPGTGSREAARKRGWICLTTNRAARDDDSSTASDSQGQGTARTQSVKAVWHPGHTSEVSTESHAPGWLQRPAPVHTPPGDVEKLKDPAKLPPSRAADPEVGRVPQLG